MKNQRRSQLEKFQQKYGLTLGDDEAIFNKKSEIHIETTEEKAEKLAELHNIPTEEIFAIVTREGINSFLNGWNNSMKSTIEKEVKEIVQDVVRDELRKVASGILGEIHNFNNQNIQNKKQENNVKDLFSHIKDDEQESELKYSASTAAEEKVETPVLGSKLLDEKIMHMYELGLDPSVGKSFRQQSSSNSTLFQNFMKQNKGIKKAWKNYVEDVIKQSTDI